MPRQSLEFGNTTKKLSILKALRRAVTGRGSSSFIQNRANVPHGTAGSLLISIGQPDKPGESPN
jgi:hypothetical protein